MICPECEYEATPITEAEDDGLPAIVYVGTTLGDGHHCRNCEYMWVIQTATLLPAGAENWSFSRLNTFETCPEREWQQYRMKAAYQRTSTGGYYGSDFHTAAETYGKHCFTNTVPVDEEAARRIAEPYVDAHGTGFARTFCAWAGRTVYDWERQIVEGDSVERWVERMLPERDGQARGLFRGRIDRLKYDAEAKIVEYEDLKTSWEAEPYDEESPPLQMAVYAWMLEGLFPEAKLIRGSIEWVRKGSRLDTWEFRPPLDVAERTICARVDAIMLADERDRRRIQPSSACGHCPYEPTCKYKAEAPAVAIGSDEEALHLWHYAAGLRASANAYTEAVGQYMTERDPIPMPDGKLLGYGPPAHATGRHTELVVVPGQELEFIRTAQAFGETLAKLVPMAGGKIAGILKSVESLRTRVGKLALPSNSKVSRLLEKADAWNPGDYLTEVDAGVTLAARKPPKEATNDGR